MLEASFAVVQEQVEIAIWFRIRASQIEIAVTVEISHRTRVGIGIVADQTPLGELQWS